MGKNQVVYEVRLGGQSSDGFSAEGYSQYELFTRYGEAIRRDMQAAAGAAGLQLSGPFKKRSDLTYPQKESLDLILVPGDIPMEFELEVEELEPSSMGSLSTKGWSALLQNSSSGSNSKRDRTTFVQLKGRVRIPTTAALWVLEPLSGEKLLVEPLAPDEEYLPFASQNGVPATKIGDRYILSENAMDALADDPSIASVRCELLNKYYQASLVSLKKVMDPSRLRPLIPISKTLKGRVVYPSQGVAVGE